MTSIAGLVVLVLLVGVAVVVAHRHGEAAACRRWHRVLDRRTAENTRLVGAGTAQQFRREALQAGRIDVGGRAMRRPSGCR